MAQKYVVQVIDDLDGTALDQADVEQVRFGLNGAAYVIDLSRGNADTLRTALSRYTDAARRDQAAGRTTTVKPRSTGSGRKDLDQVRTWANNNGYTVSSRGRIPATSPDVPKTRPRPHTARSGSKSPRTPSPPPAEPSARKPTRPPSRLL